MLKINFSRLPLLTLGSALLFTVLVSACQPDPINPQSRKATIGQTQADDDQPPKGGGGDEPRPPQE